METKHVRLQIKELADAGEFIGLAAVYNNRDFGGDVITPGAFTKTIQEKSGRFPLFYRHKVNVGVSVVEDSAEGLLTKGFLNLDKQDARDVHSDMKFYKSHGMDFGMSIGYLSIPDKTEFKGGSRVLREVMLFENTLDELPLNDRARVQSVKSLTGIEEFAAICEEIKSAGGMTSAMQTRMREIMDGHASVIEEHRALMNKFRALMDSTKSLEPLAISAEPGEAHSLLAFLKEN